MHDGPVGGNFGMECTLARLQTRYYWHRKHSSMGFTPHMMLIGREVTGPIDLVAGFSPYHEHANTPTQYVAQLRGRLEVALQIARDALGQSVERAKKAV